MKKTIIIGLVLLLTLDLIGQAQSIDNCTNTSVKIATGYNNGVNILPNGGALDLNWQVLQDPNPNNVTPYFAIKRSNASSFGSLDFDIDNDGTNDYLGRIGPLPPGNYGSFPAGEYIYSTEFCLSADATAPLIDLRCFADNNVKIYLNGNLIGGHNSSELYGWLQSNRVDIIENDMSKFNFGGLNVINAVVYNSPFLFDYSSSSLALYASISVTSGCVQISGSSCSQECSEFEIISPEEDYWLSAWVNVDTTQVKSYVIKADSAKNAHLEIDFVGQTAVSPLKLYPTGNIIDGWQRIVGKIEIPANTTDLKLSLNADLYNDTYFDDIRIHPFNASMKSYVYDGSTFWLTSELDDNNYATFYEYDNEGGLIRIKKETERGIVTIQETRSSSAK